MEMKKILVLGSSGQIGSDLVLELRNKFGSENIIATDIKAPSADVLHGGPFEFLNVLDAQAVERAIDQYQITEVYHLAAILSAASEKNPLWAWEINMRGLFNLVELARQRKFKMFWPSSIGIFGPTTPKVDTPQETIAEPITVYGISKFAGERWIEYYNRKFGTDIRSIRYPGLISYKTECGGGTTDYAVDIFYAAVREGKYECFLREDTALPMMYMDDAIRATIELMELPKERVRLTKSYNLASMSFTPKEIAAEIRKHIPNFEISYNPDFRQAIADSWPYSIDDSVARENSGWIHKFDLPKMTEVMIQEIRKKLSK
jgi:nucleoside-diphosphate-sugar epimerase